MATSGNETNSIDREVLGLEYSRLFKRNVTFTESAVHVPVDIYNKGVCVCVCEPSRSSLPTGL